MGVCLLTDTTHLMGRTLKVINIGIREFLVSLQDQGVEVVQVDWTPPAGGDSEMLEILDRLL